MTDHAPLLLHVHETDIPKAKELAHWYWTDADLGLQYIRGGVLDGYDPEQEGVCSIREEDVLGGGFELLHELAEKGIPFSASVGEGIYHGARVVNCDGTKGVLNIAASFGWLGGPCVMVQSLDTEGNVILHEESLQKAGAWARAERRVWEYFERKTEEAESGETQTQDQ